MAVSFLNSFLSYLVVLVVIAVVGAVAITLGITLRKKKNAAEEKKQTEEALCSGTLSVDELTEKSKRLPLLNDELDEKTMRWLELSEIEG